MTASGGPNGCRALLLSVVVETTNGEVIRFATVPAQWETRAGPVSWDHFFHGESVDGRAENQWDTREVNTNDAEPWKPATVIRPTAASPPGMNVTDASGSPVAIGELTPMAVPPVLVRAAFPAVAMWPVIASDVGAAVIYDFGQNMNGMVRLSLPPGHGIPMGTELRIEHGEIVQGPSKDLVGLGGRAVTEL